MNKKFLSAILFGALMVSSTGTFVSCKDYDDDIDQINSELNDIKSQIAALQTEVANGNWVTSVTPVEGGFTVTFKGGQTYTIVNGKDGAAGKPGEPGKDGKGTTVEVKDGYWYLNGEKTEYVAVKKDDLGKVKVPYVNADNMWVFFDKDGNEVVSKYNALGATCVVEANGVFTLFVPDAKGEMQEIKLPSAAAMLTDLIVLDSEAKLSYHKYYFNYNDNVNGARADWKGPRALPAKNGYIVAGMNQFGIQINPTSVDATDIDLSLVDSKNNVAAFVTLNASENHAMQSRAAYGNGMYNLGMKDVYFDEDQIAANLLNAFESQFKYGTESKEYAVTTAAGTVRSKYSVVVSHVVEEKELKQVKIALGFDSKYTTNGLGTENGSKDRPAYTGIDMGTWYNVLGVDAEAMYDMHISVTKDYATLYGVELKNELGNWQFRITKTPDNITRATFPLVVKTIDKKGALKTTTIWLKQSDILSTGYTYEAVKHQLVDDIANKNRFAVDLKLMKDYLGSDNLALWNTKVDLANTSVKIVDPSDNNNVVASGLMGSQLADITDSGVTPIIVEKNINNQNNTTIATKANFIQFQIANTEKAAEAFALNHQYVAYITFVTKVESGETAQELTTVKVPFTLTIPAITTIFQLDNNFVVDGDAICYMYAEDKDGSNAGSSTFKLNRVFSKFSTKSYTVSLDNKAKIGETNRTSANLATVGTTAVTSAATADATYITLRDKDVNGNNLKNDWGIQAGYGQSLKLSISGKFAGVWSYGDETFDFSVKVLSPIYEGNVAPKNGTEVKIPATELNGYKFGNNDIIGNTYNKAVTYKVLPDVYNSASETQWSRTEIAKVEAQSSNTNVFTLDKTNNGWATPTPATQEVDKEGKKYTVDGYFKLNAQNVPTTTSSNNVVVKVTDIWGYTKPSTVKVTITVE